MAFPLNFVGMDTLPVMEHFYTIQGEGANTGVPAYFIRLGGCDVGCHWCDVKESWDANAHPSFTVNDIVSWPLMAQAELVVITGGEPLMYDLFPLTRALKEAGLKICVETSGAHPLSGSFDWICLSPKKFKVPQPEICTRAQELKIIVFNRSDFSWAEEYASLVSPYCKLYLQPEWDRSEIMMPEIIDYVKRHPRWRISLQTHKFIGIP